jgi:hypothetical protein
MEFTLTNTCNCVQSVRHLNGKSGWFPMSYVSTGNIVIIQKQAHHIDPPQLGAALASKPSPTGAPDTVSATIREQRMGRIESDDSAESRDEQQGFDQPPDRSLRERSTVGTEMDEELPPSPTDPGAASGARAQSNPTDDSHRLERDSEEASLRAELADCKRQLEALETTAPMATAKAEGALAAEKRRVAALEQRNGQLLAEVRHPAIWF